jgi:hypothetical protein
MVFTLKKPISFPNYAASTTSSILYTTHPRFLKLHNWINYLTNLQGPHVSASHSQNALLLKHKTRLTDLIELHRSSNLTKKKPQQRTHGIESSGSVDSEKRDLVDLGAEHSEPRGGAGAERKEAVARRQLGLVRVERCQAGEGEAETETIATLDLGVAARRKHSVLIRCQDKCSGG